MPDSIAGRALRGGVVLGVRQVLVHGANLLGVVALARLLAPAEFGTIAIALFLHHVLASICTLGLGTSLVRKADEPVEDDFRTVFTTQHLVAAAVALAGWLAAPWLVALYALPGGDVVLFRAVAVATLLVPLSTVPAARLERRLRFGRLAVVEITQSLAYNATAVLLAWHGLGTRAIAVALLLRLALLAVLAQAASPWPIRYALDRSRLSRLARFGVPLQAATWITIVKDALTPLLIGLTAGVAAVGFVDWAQRVATYPTLALMILQRVYVPAFARVQDRPAELARLVERCVRATNAVAAPLAVVTLVLIGPIVELGFGERWRAAQELFYWLWCANVFVPTVTPLVGLLIALGRARAVLALALAWMLGTWLLGAPLVLLLGPLGYGVANLLVQLTAFWVVRLARERVDFALLPQVLPSWTCAVLVGVATAVVARAWPPPSLPALAALAASALLAYALLLAALLPRDARRTWAALKGEA
jgi:O-antigen/teichoic acid export membrane protein